MEKQLEINFSPQNNRHSQEILENNLVRLTKQCETLYRLFLSGNILTVEDGFRYGIGDLRARVRDLRKAGIEVKDELIEGRFKKYFI
jgi:hypothetical protein